MPGGKSPDCVTVSGRAGSVGQARPPCLQLDSQRCCAHCLLVSHRPCAGQAENVLWTQGLRSQGDWLGFLAQECEAWAARVSQAAVCWGL